MSIHRSFAVPRPLLSFFDGLSDPAKGIALALISNALFILVGVIVRELSQTIDISRYCYFDNWFSSLY